MRKKVLQVLLIFMLMVIVLPANIAFSENSWNSGEGILTIDTAWPDGSSLKETVELLCEDSVLITELNITAGTLTDDDVMWISKNLGNLETLSITDSATFDNNDLPDYAFSYYKEIDEYVGTVLWQLKSVTIDIDIDDNNSLEFGNNTFSYCQNLTDVSIPEESSFWDEAFVGCRELTNVSLPEATSFGMRAFYDCDALISISLTKATSFGDMAFESCDKLTKVDLPEATTFGGSEFASCKALTDIALPKAVTLGGYAFCRCPVLKHIELPKATTFNGNAFEDCIALESISLPETTIFSYDAFKGCTALISVNLPKVTEFGDDAFKGCTTLESISLPKTDTFGNKAFEECTALTSVDLLKVTTFGNEAFTDCDKSIIMTLGVTPPADTNVFSNYNPTDEGTPTIIVPKDAVATYDPSDTGLWYGWTINKAATPTISPNGGIFKDSVQVILASATTGTTIHYTLDGSEPTTESTKYTSPITIDQTITLKAITTAPELFNSNVLTATFTKGYTLTYAAGTGGSITGETNQLVAPNANGKQVTAVADDGYTFLKWSDGLTTASRIDTNITGDVSVTAEFTVQTKAITPTASPNGGSFTGSTQVTLASTTTGASIYYTLDESVPTTESAKYTSPITINQTTTLKAIVTASGTIDSDVMTVTFTRKSNSSSSSSSKKGSSSNSVNTVKGKADNSSFSAGTKKTAYNSEGKKETIVTVKESAIKKQVNKVDEGDKISIPVEGNTDISKGIFSVQSIKDMQKKDLVLEVKTDNATYELPTGVIDVKAISDQIGEEVDLEDIPFTVTISKTNKDMTKVVETSAKKGKLAIVVPPVDFKIEATYKGKSCKVDKFKAFVKRTIEIPSNVDASKITTAMITEADGSIRHVPTYITKIDGKYYATINALTNSTYTLIYNEVTFSDVTDSYWAKADIEKMASRLVVEGKQDGTFSPDESITRAELAQILVKALGLNPVEIDKFVDVKSGTEYAGYIGTAYSYGVIKGTSETTYNPKGLVTRQDAMAMIYRASMIADLVDENHITDMTGYVDYKDVSNYAKDAVMWNVNNGIIVGKTATTLVPFDNITRAELSAVTNRFLKSAGLIE